MAEGPYGSAHEYKIWNGSVEIGSFMVSSKKLDKAIKFPAMNVRRTRLYPEVLPAEILEKDASSPIIVGSGIIAIKAAEAKLLKLAAVNTDVAAAENATARIHLGTGMLGEYPEYAPKFGLGNSGEKLLSGIRQLAAHVGVKKVEAVAQPLLGKFEELKTSYNIKDKQTPFYLRPHMFLSNAKRLEPIHSSEHRSELVQKLYSMPMFDIRTSPVNSWETIKEHFEEGDAHWIKYEHGFSEVDTAWIYYSFRQDSVAAAYVAGYPTTQLEVSADWFSFGRHEERYSADWSSIGRHDESTGMEFSHAYFNWSEFFSSPIKEGPVSVYQFAHIGKVQPAKHGEEFSAVPMKQQATALYKYSSVGEKLVDTAEKQFSAVSATSIMHKMLTAFTGHKLEKINNLRTFSALQSLVIADPVWVEPTITVPEDKGLFSSALLAGQDATANATHTWRAVQFKNGYLWNEDVDVVTKTCYSFGSMSRTPYKWNMQLRNCWADAKKSGYVGGG